MMSTSTPGWRLRLVPVMMYLGCGVNANMMILTLVQYPHQLQPGVYDVSVFQDC